MPDLATALPRMRCEIGEAKEFFFLNAFFNVFILFASFSKNLSLFFEIVVCHADEDSGAGGAGTGGAGTGAGGARTGGAGGAAGDIENSRRESAAENSSVRSRITGVCSWAWR